MANGHALPGDWSGPPPHGQLEGPGMPVQRNALPMGSVSMMNPMLPMGPPSDHPASAAADTATEMGEGEGEGDDRTYCFCDGVSYGEMIACDDDDCEREWVRFLCSVVYRTTTNCGPASSSTSTVSASRRSLRGRGSAMCARPSKKIPSAPQREAESASEVARVQAQKSPTTLDLSRVLAYV